jgi:hypothetical protein
MSFNDKEFKFEGHTTTFKFIIKPTKSFEPFIVSIYDLLTNIEGENYFVKNLFFDKNHLFKFFKLANENPLLYQEFILLK